MDGGAGARRLVVAALSAVVLTVCSYASFLHLQPGRRLVRVLESRFAQTVPPPSLAISGIIVPGGDLRRTVEATALAKRYPTAKLVITGVGEEAAHRVARAEGIESSRLILETEARTTFENAVFSARLLNPRSSERWILVTTASHMPRAVGSFRAAGFSVLPWPVEPNRDYPHPSNAVAQHEWLGLIAYWLRGRTDSLFPAPDSIASGWTPDADLRRR